ncbi:hypothetical protein [Brevibacillus sp. 179-C9.3 HS]|uniref:hypothetical protein n=1 Tax=unclassified Brevibacillus TaxID=2684853 RepID=UPI0039A3DB60
MNVDVVKASFDFEEYYKEVEKGYILTLPQLFGSFSHLFCDLLPNDIDLLL